MLPPKNIFRPVIRCLFYLVLLLLFAGISTAQTRIHRSLTPADGLVQSQVISLHEDHEGYLWIGTFGGLSRWDGRSFRNFTRADGMGHNEVQGIAENVQGVLFFATKGGGISIFENDQFSVLNADDGLPANVCRSVVMMPNGDVAVGTDAGVCLIRDGRVIVPEPESGLTDILVVNLAVTTDGTLHVATWGDGLLLAKGAPLKVIERIPDLPVEKIRALTIGADDQVYFSPAGSGVFSLDGSAAKPLTDDPTFDDLEIVALYVQADGTLLIGTQNRGLFRWGSQIADQLDKTNGLVSNAVWAFSEGRDGLLFLGTWGGVSIFDNDRVMTLAVANGLGQDIVTSIDFSRNGSKIYFGFPEQGVQQYHQGELTTLEGTDHENLHQVWVVHESPDGSLLIGSDYGVHRHQAGRMVTIPSVDGTQLRSVQAIVDAFGGGQTVMDMHGLFRLENKTLISVFGDSDTGINKATDVLEVSPGQYLLASIDGVFTVDERSLPVKVQPHPRLDALSDGTVWALHRLKDGRFLFGTNEKGLAVFSPEAKNDSTGLYFLDKSKGLSDNTVLAIVEDEDGAIFLSTNRGLNVLQPEGPGWKIKHIGYQDGLGSDECVQGALAISPEGYVWVGTIGGASRYDKRSDLSISSPPLLKIDKFSIFDREIPLGEFETKPEFSHLENYLKIEFTGIHLPKPDEVFYRYRLSSVDLDWVQSKRQYVQYTNLAAGHYQFEISANLPNGSSSATQVWEFTVKPPFWRTWWFLLLSVLIVAGSIGLVVMFRVRQLLALERLRTGIAADLHDDIGSGLTEISIISSLIPSKLPHDSKVLIEGDVERIGETSRQLITSMSDIVWLVNPKLDSLFDLLAKLGESSAETLSSSGIHFEDINLDELKKTKLPMEHRRQLLLIFKEAINNAVKYSDSDHIRLEAQCRGKVLCISLKDNGRGFDPSVVVPVGGGNGLGNMKSRAGEIKGELKIESSPGAGTLIEFHGPTR